MQNVDMKPQDFSHSRAFLELPLFFVISLNRPILSLRPMEKKDAVWVGWYQSLKGVMGY